MRTKNTFGISFIARTEREKDGKVPVIARITVDAQRAHISLKYWVDAEIWDNKKGGAKSNRDGGREIMHYLEQVRTEIGDCYRELQVNREIITAEAVKDAFLRTDEEIHTLNGLIIYHREHGQERLKASTLIHYRVTERYLERFLLAKIKAKDINLHDINYRFVVDFETFLRTYKSKDHPQPLKNNGIMKHIIRLRKMINLALKLEWMAKDPFANYKMKFDKVEKECLNKHELERLEKKTFTVDRLDFVRDLFVFACYTGLAYVDVANLTADHIVTGNDNESWLKLNRQKTTTPVQLPLLPQAVKIIKKYKNDIRANAMERVFPILSNQKVNSYLGEIADLCTIKKRLTFHIARHTFATTVTLANGVPIETVSRMLGHTKIVTTQIYAHIHQERISADMAELKKRLNGNRPPAKKRKNVCAPSPMTITRFNS